MIENHETDKFDNTSFNKLGRGGKIRKRSGIYSNIYEI